MIRTDEGTLRLYTVAGHECLDTKIHFNGEPHDFRDRLFVLSEPVGNFGHNIGILWSEGDHSVLDDAADLALLDGRMCADQEHKEEDEGDERSSLGNDSAYYDLSDIQITEISQDDYRKDADFMFALGRASESLDITTADDL